MKAIPYIYYGTVAGISIFSLWLMACSDTYVPNQELLIPNSSFEPADGQALFILGQANEKTMRAYMSDVKETPIPAGFAFYTSLSGNQTLTDMERYKSFMNDYPNTTLQLAIWTGERRWGNPGYYLDDIIHGRHDENIETLAEACMSIDKPIYIRFGYEFDGLHNAYPPDKYIKAYKYFVDKMREYGVTNVAYIWHSWGVGAYYGREDYPGYYPELAEGQHVTQELWYPGDDYVDWVAMSVFDTGWGNLSTNQVVQWLISFAEERDKPVMLAETAAINPCGSNDPDWVIPNTNWFQNVFSLIDNNDIVKAFTYINVDWEDNWGDTRIQMASDGIMSYWLQKVEPLLHANEELYSKINYNR